MAKENNKFGMPKKDFERLAKALQLTDEEKFYRGQLCKCKQPVKGMGCLDYGHEYYHFCKACRHRIPKAKLKDSI